MFIMSIFYLNTNGIFLKIIHWFIYKHLLSTYYAPVVLEIPSINYHLNC